MHLAVYFSLLTFLVPHQASDGLVEVIEAQKPPYQAKLDSFQAESTWVIRDSQRQLVSNSNLLMLRFPNKTIQASSPVYRLQLTDGSEIACTSIESDGKNYGVRWADHQASFATQQLLTLRFRELNQDQQATWDSISQSVASSDVLCLVQPSGAITKIEGIVLGISGAAVRFEFSGQKVDVPFSKLAGIRFYSNIGVPREKIQVIATDTAGNQWMATELLSADVKTKVDIGLQCGARVQLSLDDLQSLDYSFGSQLFLADIEPLQQTVPKLFDLSIDIPAEKILFGASKVVPTDLPGRALGPSLRFLGSGEATYRVPEGFQRLVGSVELRPTGDKFTPCRVQVWIEGKLLLDEKILNPKEPMDLDLPVGGDQRLRLVVTAESSFPTGDVVIWRELRLLK